MAKLDRYFQQWLYMAGKPTMTPDTFFRGPTEGSVNGTVPATLSLTLGTPGSFGAFTPGVARDYAATTTANVISSAGDAALSVADPSATAPGRLVNGGVRADLAAEGQGEQRGGAGSAFARAQRRAGDPADLRRPDQQRRA